MRMNRLATCKNPYQGKAKRVLCVCSAGLLRSPTAAVVLSQPPFEFNTRAAGSESEFALIPVDEVLITWADEIVCMESRHAEVVERMLDVLLNTDEKRPPIYTLAIKDNYEYGDAVLKRLIASKYRELSGYDKE